ncbi:MAG: GCN5-related N-acetyltransferase [Thermoleophilia bacterium]|nr:GCN5-related N-acetyltransferase [Thermoleophilia bacterium]
MTEPFERVTLEGAHVRLEPLGLEHVDGLVRAFVPGTLDLMSATADCVEPSDPAAATTYVEEALEGWRDGRYLPFAVIDRATGEVIGCTRYGDIARDVPRVEIGWTWYTPAARGTMVNPECKLLLLGHAFDTLGCEAVILRTSAYNLHSQGAIAKLGATRDGVLRRHVYQRDGRLRDTVVFSILRDAWPAVRSGLLRRLAPDAPPRATLPADLVVRRAVPADAEAYLDYRERNEAFLAAWEPLPPPGGRDLAWAQARVAPDDRRQLYVAERAGRIVGQAMLGNIARDAFENATLGYSVDEHEQGRGIASAMVRHALGEAFGPLGLHRVEAGTLLDNAASRRVLERAGFTYIGVSPRHVSIAGRWQDHALYAVTVEAVADQLNVSSVETM